MLPVKGQLVNILSLADQTVSVATTEPGFVAKGKQPWKIRE